MLMKLKLWRSWKFKWGWCIKLLRELYAACAEESASKFKQGQEELGYEEPWIKLKINTCPFTLAYERIIKEIAYQE